MKADSISIESEWVGERLVVHIDGNLDVHNVHIIEQDLLNLVKIAKTHIIYDLEKVNYISSAGLRVLVTSLRLCQDSGIQISICSLKPAVERVFDIISMKTLFQIHPDLKTALL